MRCCTIASVESAILYADRAHSPCTLHLPIASSCPMFFTGPSQYTPIRQVCAFPSSSMICDRARLKETGRGYDALDGWFIYTRVEVLLGGLAYLCESRISLARSDLCWPNEEGGGNGGAWPRGKIDSRLSQTSRACLVMFLEHDVPYVAIWHGRSEVLFRKVKL